MPGKEDRAKRREAKLRAMEAEFDRLLVCLMAPTSLWDRHRTMGKIVDLLQRVNAADIPLWPFEKRIEGVLADNNKYAAEFYAAFRGMIAQIVNGRLAGKTPGTVDARYRETNFGRRCPKKFGVHK